MCGLFLGVAATVGIIIVAVPIEVIGRYFSQHLKGNEYTRGVEAACEVDGKLDLSRLHAKLVRLSLQGLLKVRLPTREELRQLVTSYDGKGDGRLDLDEWAKLVEDVVAHRGDWEGCAVRKTVEYLREARGDLHAASEELAELHQRRAAQYAELGRIMRVRYPNGLPAGGDVPKGLRSGVNGVPTVV